MYRVEQSTFGEFECYHLSSNDGANLLRLVPAFGLNLLELRLDGQSLLDAYTSPEEMKIGQWCKNVLLFPFPNRLKDGTYQHDGQQYQFPINEPSTNTALHGFGTQVTFEVVEYTTAEDQAEIHCRYDYSGERADYPFPFQLDIGILLSTIEGLRMTMKIQNKGASDLPIGIGWHPYFAFGEAVEDLQLQLPACQKVMIDGQMIPTGEKTTFDDFSKLSEIGATELDNCFALLPNESGLARAIIESSEGQLQYWQESGEGKFPFLQAFTPPSRQSVALEPMSCNIDGLNNREGLTVLKPAAIFEASCGLQWQSKS